MKKILTLSLIAVMSIAATSAATPKQTTVSTTKQTTTSTATSSKSSSVKVDPKVVITTTKFAADIDCADCEKKIMSRIPFEKGVSAVDVDLKKGIVIVSYDKSKNSDTSLIKSFKKIKITAKVIK